MSNLNSNGESIELLRASGPVDRQPSQEEIDREDQLNFKLIEKAEQLERIFSSTSLRSSIKSSRLSLNKDEAKK